MHPDCQGIFHTLLPIHLLSGLYLLHSASVVKSKAGADSPSLCLFFSVSFSYLGKAIREQRNQRSVRAERGKQLPIPSSHLTESLTFRLQGSRLAKSVLRMGFPSSISISVSQYSHEKSQLRSVVSNVAIHSSPISAVTLPIKHLYLKGKIQSVNVCVKAFYFAAIAHILHVL